MHTVLKPFEKIYLALPICSRLISSRGVPGLRYRVPSSCLSRKLFFFIFFFRLFECFQELIESSILTKLSRFCLFLYWKHSLYYFFRQTYRLQTHFTVFVEENMRFFSFCPTPPPFWDPKGGGLIFKHFFQFWSESQELKLTQKIHSEIQKFTNGFLKYCFSKAQTVLSNKHVVSEKNISEGSQKSENSQKKR